MNDGYAELINTYLPRNTHKHVSIFKVISPVWPDLPLASNVPDVQFEALRLHALNVKALAKTGELKLNWTWLYCGKTRENY